LVTNQGEQSDREKCCSSTAKRDEFIFRSEASRSICPNFVGALTVEYVANRKSAENSDAWDKAFLRNDQKSNKGEASKKFGNK
jgi:hypothetical protein